MGWIADLRVLYHLALKPVRGDDHATRLESFYAGQADAYDAFRRRLLQGRERLWELLEVPGDGVWVDLGGGTGANLEFFPPGALQQLRRIYVVDLADSLLDVLRRRIREHGWQNVVPVQADATTFRPDEGVADVVTCSYSLTMIPDWYRAIDNAHAMLRPDGRLGVVDFYVSRKYPTPSYQRHPWWTRQFWPLWFGNDNVFLSPDHLPYLQQRFRQLHLEERRARVPYMPLGRVPYYLFVGSR